VGGILVVRLSEEVRMKIQVSYHLRPALALLVVAALLLTTGCASFQGHRIPQAGPSPSRNIQNKPKVFVEAEFFVFIEGKYDTPMQDYEKGPLWLTVVDRSFAESQIFSQVTTNSSKAKDMDLTIRVDFTHSYNDTAALVADIVTGITFFGFPTWRKDTFKLEAVVRDNRGNSLQEYAYEDHVTTWRHFFLLPFIGSAKKAPERVITNMMRYFLRELSTERILQPYFQNKRGDERAEEALVREKPPVAQITTIPRVEKMDVRVIVPQAVIRLHPNPDSPVITPVPMGATLEVKEKTGNWYQVTFLKEGIVVGGYIHENSVEVIKKFGETALEI